MIYTIKNEDELKDIKELDDLQTKVKQVRLVEKIGKRGFHYDTKELFVPLTEKTKNTSEDVTKTITETSIKKSEALDISKNEKLSELMNDKGIIEPYLASS